MTRVGVISYGSRGAAIADALASSEGRPEVYIAGKQENPMNIDTAARTGGKHAVMDLSDVQGMASFFQEGNVDFVFPGPEKPIIAGLADELQERNIPALCPTVTHALEGSKVWQRVLLEKVAPEANPRYRVFTRGEYKDDEVKGWLKELDYQVAIKPNTPTAGKGVGVAEDHFTPEEEEAFAYFQAVMEGCPCVLIEERLDGEESSHMALSDGKVIVPFRRDTRDYKRAEDRDTGPNTGGMGSYSDVTAHLPFMISGDFVTEEIITNGIFQHLKEQEGYRREFLCGIPFYMAFIHTKDGPKVLEINSRGGDPELLNIIPLIDKDFLELCMEMVFGQLRLSIPMKPQASVVVYKVPIEYGRGKAPGGRYFDMHGSERKCADREHYRLYHGDMSRDLGKYRDRTSRTVACVGIDDTIPKARERAMELVHEVYGDLRHRNDIAHERHIQASVEHMKSLRAA